MGSYGWKEVKMDRRTAEASRYLGYGRQNPDTQTKELMHDCFQQLDASVDPRIVSRIFDLKRSGEGHIAIGNLQIESRNLGKNLKGCERAVLLGATLGVGVDQLMKRYSYTDMARVVVLQACAAACLEEYLDRWQAGFGEKMREEGYYLRPRFSPGYGDFSIQHQGALLRMLDAPKKIGLGMTESGMLTPTKSVTALIGMGRQNVGCHVQGCEECAKTDCIYRRC